MNRMILRTILRRGKWSTWYYWCWRVSIGIPRRNIHRNGNINTLFSINMCSNKITEKRKIVKTNLKTQAFKMTRLAREKFPRGKVGNTVKVWVLDADPGRCDSRNILGVIMEADLVKDLYRIGTKDGILNSWYARNQFSTCTKGTVNIACVLSVNFSLRECAGKA